MAKSMKCGCGWTISPSSGTYSSLLSSSSLQSNHNTSCLAIYMGLGGHNMRCLRKLPPAIGIHCFHAVVGCSASLRVLCRHWLVLVGADSTPDALRS